MPELRVVFMGTAELACASLLALLQAPLIRVVAVVTQPDRPKGRELKLSVSPVKEVAVKAGLPVLQPERARAETFLTELTRHAPDLIVVAAYGQLLPQALLDLPRFGCINVHTSLLPKYRGAAPIQWAILNGDTVTGATIMKVDAGLDTGPILNQVETPIRPEDNAQTLHDRLAALGAELLIRTIPGYVSGAILPRPQPTEGTFYARKLSKEDGRLDWAQPAIALWNRVRAFTPWPGAFTWLPMAGPKPALLKVWSAQVEEAATGAAGELIQADKHGLVVRCGEQALRIVELQREGGRRLKAREFLLGHPLEPGQSFT